MSLDLEVGDTVRVKPKDQCKDTDQVKVREGMDPFWGKTYVVEDVKHEHVFLRDTDDSALCYYFSPGWVDLIEKGDGSVTTTEPAGKKQCTCSFDVIWAKGCQCGGV